MVVRFDSIHESDDINMIACLQNLDLILNIFQLVRADAFTHKDLDCKKFTGL